ncbi:EEF1A lysine methyltransferase 2 [Cephus cinctus]|uniref:Protein-lysine N-methyltransferase LOC107263044 n=1 Tax=Cephus cinctus TaxID=211228 RepID=A0AAJ7BG79_CEPCN|nr:EEF1A lysine methyltransferase 2 [Cephus cinctus]
MTENDSQELYPSDLGTQEYWEKTYALEIANFRSHGDVGEVWFGEDSALRIVRWMRSRTDLINQNDKIIDLGCGNGMMLVELAEEGFKNMTGVDYSKKAIDLARGVLKNKELSNIDLQVCDILSEDQSSLTSDFKVAHDKGTYDAISLNPDNPKEKREKYIKNVHNILLPNGLFILTSCNWTESELQSQFKDYFKVLQMIPTPSFKFGGKVGNTVTSVVFQKI